MDIKNFESTSKDVISFVPAGTIPKSIQLPSKFKVKGKLQGSMTNFQTKLTLKSSYGAAKADVTFDQHIKNKEKYNGEISLTDFDLGKLIPVPLLNT